MTRIYKEPQPKEEQAISATSVNIEFDVTISDLFGYFLNHDKALHAIQTYQERTGMKYCVAWSRKKDLDYKNIKDDSKPFKIFWSDGGNSKVKSCQMMHDGIPYLVESSRIYDCQFGIDRNLCQKRKYKERMSDRVLRRQQNNFKRTKKQNCPALIYLREIVKFPDFEIPSNTEFYRKKASANLQKAIKDGTACGEMRVYIHFPAMSDHAYHSLMEGVKPNVDPRVKGKIEELVSRGIKDLSSVKEKLTHYVHTELFEWEKWPEKTNQQFYPTTSYIKNQVNNVVIQLRSFQVDLENIEAKIESWLQSQPEDKFYFRTRLNKPNECKPRSSQQMVLLMQTRWQWELLKWHGQELCLLDPVYKSVGASLPIYFLLVKTHVDYQVVGSILMLNDTVEAICEALKVFRDWNPKWNPSTFMCGVSEVEASAIRLVFGSVRVLICDYQREQAWDRWLSDKRNNMATTRDGVLNHLQRMAYAASPEELSAAEEAFFLSDPWLKLKRLQIWFTKGWQRKYERWVWCQRGGDPSSYEGVEQVNETFRHYYSQLPPPRPPISHVITIMLNHFNPALYQRHLQDSATAELHLCLDPDPTPEKPTLIPDDHKLNLEDTPPQEEHLIIEEPSSQEYLSQEVPEDPVPLPDSPQPSEDFAHKCREIVDHIRSYTYLMNDQGALKGLYNSLLATYDNILQYDKDTNRKKQTQEVKTVTPYQRNERKSQMQGVVISSSPGQRSTQIKCEVVTPSELFNVVTDPTQPGRLEDVLVDSDSKQALFEDVAGSYVVHNNVLELVKSEMSMIPEQQEEFGLEFNTPVKVGQTCTHHFAMVKPKVQENSSPMERLKLIPPEVFKLLLSTESKPKPSKVNSQGSDSKAGILPKTFRILIPIKNKKKTEENNPVRESQTEENMDGESGFALTSSMRKRLKIEDLSEPSEPRNKGVKYIKIHKNLVPSEKQGNT